MMCRLLGLALLLFAPLSAAAEPHPETQLLTALDDLNAGRADAAWRGLERLVQRQPNFRLAQLFYGELLAARSGARATRLAAAEADVEGLREEARLRLKHWRELPPAGSIPDAVLQLGAARRAVVVSLRNARLYLLERSPDTGALRVTHDYYASSGKNGIGKQTTGDNRTPVGIYTIKEFLSDAQLPELYGAGAFPVDYPNAWDRRHGRTGSGIWLHGVPRETFNRVPRSSEGCVTVANADFTVLAPGFELGRTPVVLSDTLTWVQPGEAARQRDEFLRTLEDWRARWAALDTEGYLAYYADDFETDGMGKRAFAEYKRRVNAGKSFVDVQLADVDVFRYPGAEPIWLARFIQHYRSDNLTRTTRKQQYWRRDADGALRIVMEVSGG